MSSTIAIGMMTGAIFGPIGGLCAGIITYMEYSRRLFPPREAVRDAANAGLFAFMVLVMLSIGVGYVLGGVAVKLDGNG